MGFGGFGFVLGMELTADKPRMVGELHDLHQAPVGTGTGETHAVGFELLSVLVIEFVSMPIGKTPASRRRRSEVTQLWSSTSRFKPYRTQS